jgi:hypothetical protein
LRGQELKLRHLAAAEADRETIMRNFISGQYDRPVRVVAFKQHGGWSRDVWEDIPCEVLHRACDADEVLTEGTRGWHVTAGKEAAAGTVCEAP